MASTVLLLGVLLCFPFVLGVELLGEQPEVAYTRFQRNEGSLHFFANSSSALYVVGWTNTTIHVTHDDGKTWKEVELPSNMMKEVREVIMHPFDNRYAIVETAGMHHYKTSDQGLTWQSFEILASPVRNVDHVAFHSYPNSTGSILIQGSRCVPLERLGERCYIDYYYTRDGFSSEPSLLVRNAWSCQFAHPSKEFVNEEHRDLIFCLVNDEEDYSSTRLLASSDFFNNDKRVVDLGLGKLSYSVAELSFVGKFALARLRVESGGEFTPMTFVSTDLKHWERLGTSDDGIELSGTLFVSDANGNNFVESLKDVKRGWNWRIQYDQIAGVEHVGIVNIVASPDEPRSTNQKIHSRITFDDGSSWLRLIPSSEDAANLAEPCDPTDEETCSLHFHRPDHRDRLDDLTGKKRIKSSSPAPGVVIRVGSIGEHLAPYKECDTFISTDAGASWKLLMKGPHMVEFANHGSLMVLIKDDGDTDTVLYSIDSGLSWSTIKLEHSIRAIQLSAMPDSTSWTVLLTGRIAHEDDKDIYSGGILFISLDFSSLRRRQCTEDDFEKWFMRDGISNGCVLGQKKWYLRRKIGSDCYIGRTLEEGAHEGVDEDCPCTEFDYECDFKYVRQGKKCVPAVPESIPPGTCHNSQDTYLGPSGYRLKAGNMCNRRTGIIMDLPVEKGCRPPELPEGEMAHKFFEFPAEVVQTEFMRESQTILVRLRDGTVWQSPDEGYTWSQLFPDEHFLTFMTHWYADARAYLITPTSKYYYTTDYGRNWIPASLPLPPNTFGAPELSFSPNPEYLIWVGDADCSGSQAAMNCHAEAYYSLDHGRNWKIVDSYVRRCEWGRDVEPWRYSTQIMCGSYKEKQGNQRHFNDMTNSIELVSGAQFYKEKRVVLENVVGSWRSPDYMLIAQYQESARSLALSVSHDGTSFSEAVFPTGLHPSNRYYEIIDSTRRSVLAFLLTSQNPNPYWGALLKSDTDGRIYVLSLDFVNRNDRGHVDIARPSALKGTLLANVVADPRDAIITGRKELVTRISHNDGGSWKALDPPRRDSSGQDYLCRSNQCALHLHTFSERPNSRSSLSISSRPDLLISVGNVGETLAPYKECSTFLSRDAGFTWEEIRKGTYVWAFGDKGSLLVMAGDSVATDHVIYSTNEGLTWHEYKLRGLEKIRVRSIVTADDSTRRFVLSGYYPHSMDAAVAVQLDFSFLAKTQCTFDEEHPSESDFEFWSPSEGHQHPCLFGRKVYYPRRIRNRSCFIGNLRLHEKVVPENCPCTEDDFECEFNHVRDESGVCALVPGTKSLPSNTTCASGESVWYERSAYRKIGYSTCENGVELDRGAEHECTEHIPEADRNNARRGWFFWNVIIYLSLVSGVTAAYAVFRCCGFAKGKIRLEDEDEGQEGAKTGLFGQGVLHILVSPLLFLGRFVAGGAKCLQSVFRGRADGAVRLGEDEHLLNIGADQRR